MQCSRGNNFGKDLHKYDLETFVAARALSQKKRQKLAESCSQSDFERALSLETLRQDDTPRHDRNFIPGLRTNEKSAEHVETSVQRNRCLQQ